MASSSPSSLTARATLFIALLTALMLGAGASVALAAGSSKTPSNKTPSTKIQHPAHVKHHKNHKKHAVKKVAVKKNTKKQVVATTAAAKKRPIRRPIRPTHPTTPTTTVPTTTTTKTTPTPITTTPVTTTPVKTTTTTTSTPTTTTSTPTHTTSTPTHTTPTTTTPTTTTPTHTTPTTTTPTTTTPTHTTPTTTTPTTTTPTTTTPTTTTPTTTTPTTTTPTTTTPTTTTPTTTTTTPTPVGISGNWNMVMDSEFTGSSLPSKWATGWYGSGVTGGVGGTSEADCYSPSDVTFPGDGSMHLNLTQTTTACDGVSQPWSTGFVTTDPSDGRSGAGFTYTYGVAEAKVYIPANGGQIADWPSFWADGTGTWPATGEDDVLEGLGGEACFHFHDPLGGPGGCDTTLTAGWHTFASDWQPGSVTYYYDGKDVGSIASGITSSPMYLILGNGVSSTLSDTIADSMQVAYVRVWQS